MAITSLSEVTNDYGSYRGNSLIGEKGAAVTVPNDGLEGIVGKPYPFLNGILLEIGGTLYTDQGYLNALKAAGNPYLSKRSLPVVPLRLSDLTELVPDIEVYDEDGPVYRTQYAEVNVTKRMSTIDDILFYLNDFFNPNTTDTVLDPKSIGSFSLGTTSYSADLDVNGLYPGLEFETLEDIKTATTVKVSTPPTQTEPKKPEPKVEVKVLEEKPLSVVVPQDVIDLSDFKLDPIDLDFSDFDFGFGNINTDFGFGLGGDVSVGGSNQFTSVNSAGDDFTTRASTAYRGFVTDDNDVNEPEIYESFGRFGSFGF